MPTPAPGRFVRIFSNAPLQISSERPLSQGAMTGQFVKASDFSSRGSEFDSRRESYSKLLDSSPTLLDARPIIPLFFVGGHLPLSSTCSAWHSSPSCAPSLASSVLLQPVRIRFCVVWRDFTLSRLSSSSATVQPAVVSLLSVSATSEPVREDGSRTSWSS